MRTKSSNVRELRPEYRFDYSKGIQGKYFGRLLSKGASMVALDPDVARAFPTSEAVNEALRVVLKASEAVRRKPGRPRRAPSERATKTH